MPQFNLQDYETVEERLRRFHSEYSDGRIVTENVTTPEDRATSTWVVKAYIYLTAGDQAENLPKATGYAFEVEGQGGMANKTSALENCETSAIGRALANMSMSGNKRASREEMEKVERMTAKGRGWIAEASMMTKVDDLRNLWLEAKEAKAPQKTLDLIKELGDAASDTYGQRVGAEGSVRGSGEKS